jgi:hypothetical protein
MTTIAIAAALVAAMPAARLASKAQEPAADVQARHQREDGKIFFKLSDDKRVQLVPREQLVVKPLDAPPVGDPVRVLPPEVTKFEPWYRSGDVRAAPPKSLSLRSRQSLVADQGARGTCVAFAVSAALEAAYGGHDLFSSEYLYWLLSNKKGDVQCTSDGASFIDAAYILPAEGLPHWYHWPYMPITSPKLHLCPVGPTSIAKDHARFKAARTVLFDLGDNPSFLESVIASGHEAVLGIQVAFPSWKKNLLLRGVLDVIVDPATHAPLQSEGAHAVLVVGYERTGDSAHGGGYFLVKNSWGMLMGEGGYLKLSYDYIRQYGAGGMIILAVDPAPPRCPGDFEKNGLLCYPPCKQGYHGVGPVCWELCPAGFHDDGATCRRDAHVTSADNGKCPWSDKCGLVSAKGCSKCPAGSKNDGCTCRIDALITRKRSYGRGVGTTMR